MDRRTFLQLSGMAALASAGGVGCNYFSGRGPDAATPAPANTYTFDPIREENFQQKLFIPGDSGPFGVLDVGAPLQINATAASFPILNGQASPFLLYQTEQAGKPYQNPILRVESGSRFRATLHNQLAEPTITVRLKGGNVQEPAVAPVKRAAPTKPATASEKQGSKG